MTTDASIQQPTKKPRLEAEEHKDIVVTRCSDGEVAMSKSEFAGVVHAGTVLKHLVYGHTAMCAEDKLDVFHRFNVSSAALNVIRSCIRQGGKLPNDASAMALTKSGDLRNAADALGGFQLVDQALATSSRNIQPNHEAAIPKEDITGMFEWRTTLLGSSVGSDNIFQQKIYALGEENFVWTSMTTLDHPRAIHHFRRACSGTT